MPDVFVTLVSIQPAMSGMSSSGNKFQNRPQSSGHGPGSLFETRRDGTVIRAKQAEGSGAQAPVYATRRPPDVTNVTVEALASPSHAVRVTWDNRPADIVVLNYRLFYSTSPIFDPNTWTQVEVPVPNIALLRPHFDLTGLAPSTNYYFTFRAENSWGPGPLTPPGLAATTPPDPPSPPTNLALFSMASGLATLWWSDVTGATGYAIYTSTQPLVTKSDTRTTPAISPKSIAKPGGGSLYARIAAIGPGGEGDLSAVTFVNVLP